MKKLLMSFILLTVFTSNAHSADWFDSMLDQNISSPSVYMNQQRGYFTAGGVQSRTPNSRIRLVSLTPPKITAGCGGIDIFWGGFSFMNPEYLVQAFQNFLSHAPAFAFDLALKTLCSQCSETMKALESIANKVNSMASDDCAISKAGVDWSLGGMFDSIGLSAAPGGENPTSDIMTKVNKNILDNIDGALGSITQDFRTMVSQTLCNMNPNLKACGDFHLESGSFWAKVAKFDKATASSGQNALSSFEAEMMASIFGDVFFVTNNKAANGSTNSTPPANQEQDKTLLSTLYAVPPLESKLGPQALLMYFIDFPDESVTDIWDKIELYDLTQANGPNYGSAVTRSFPDELRFGKKAYVAINEIAAIFRAGGVDSIEDDTISAINESPIPLYSILNTYAFKYYQGGSIHSAADREKILNGDIKPGAEMLGNFISVPEARNLAKLAAIGKAYNFMTKWNARGYAIMSKYRAMHAAGREKSGFPKESYTLAFQSIQERMMIFNSLLSQLFQKQKDELSKQIADELAAQDLKNLYTKHLKQSFKSRQ